VSTVFIYARRRVGAVVGTLACLPLLFLGYGFEDALWPINAGFVATLALGTWALMTLEGVRPSRHAVVCVLLMAALACSELALVFALAVGVELTWRERSLRRCWVWLTPILLYFVWWLAYYEPSGMGSGLTGMPSFAASMAAAAIAGLFGLDPTWGHSLIVAALVLAVWGFSRAGAFTPRVAALLVLACSYWLLVAYGRNANPDASRYVYVGSVFLLLIGVEALRRFRVRPAALVVGALVALFALAGNLHELSGGEGEFRAGSQTSRAELGALDLIRATVSPSILIDQHYMPAATVEQYFASIRAFGSTPADTPAQILREPEAAREAADGLLLRAGIIRISPRASATPPNGVRPPSVEARTAVTQASTGRCVRFTSSGAPSGLELRLGGSVELINRSGSPVEMLGRRFGNRFGANRLPDLPGRRTVVVSARPDADPLPWVLGLVHLHEVIACALP
jgi:hypothetical protein